MSFFIEDILKKDDDAVKQNHNSQLRVSFLKHRSDSWYNVDTERLEEDEIDEQKANNRTTEKFKKVGKKKRRILFTREQTYELEKVFKHQQYLTVQQREYLSKKVHLTSTQVKIWFQNHRYKLKKYFKDIEKETEKMERCHCAPCRRKHLFTYL